MDESDSKQKVFTPQDVEALGRDPINRKIFGALQADARLSYADLGRAVNLSAPAVFERVRRLERAGLLRYSIEIDAEKAGLPFTSFIRIAATGGQRDEMVAGLEQLSEVEECHTIAGEDCILVKARTANPLGLDLLLQRIKLIPGVARTLTTAVLRTHFERGVQMRSLEAEEEAEAASSAARAIPHGAGQGRARRR
ncbi:MAG: Lrp/AsnC family transcriptional regulator [Verrucomicrobia bacterium]|nr:Lrp/AsnC family transcriptional regulator [Verrucomicrobiota bacterium]